MTGDPVGVPRLPGFLERAGMIGGFGAVGVSAFGLMGAGPRVLGVTGYTALALTWTVVIIIGVGVATPGEQVTTRAIAAGAGAGTVRMVARRLAYVAPLTFVLVPLLAKDSVSGAHTALWFAALLASTLAYTVLAIQRGKLAGCRYFGAYSLTLFGEAGSRVVLVALAFLVPAAGPALLAAAVALPLILAAAMSWWWARRIQLATGQAIAEDTRLEHGSITAVAVLIQVSMNTAQLWLHRQSPDLALSGAFVTVAAYMRVPMTLAGGVYAPLLNEAAAAYAERRRAVVLKKTMEALLLGSGGSFAMVVVLLVFSNVAMVILYGGDTGLSSATFVWLGIATVAHIAAGVLTNALYGCARAPTAVLCWIPPAVVSTLLFAMAHGDPTFLAVATTIGQVVALVLMLGAFFARALPSAVQARTDPAF